jgi:hypothetical protein
MGAECSGQRNRGIDDRAPGALRLIRSSWETVIAVGLSVGLIIAFRELFDRFWSVSGSGPTRTSEHIRSLAARWKPGTSADYR